MGIETQYKVAPGVPGKFGPTIYEEGVNFAVVSSSAKKVSLCFFDPKSQEKVFEVPLDPQQNRTGRVWHIFIYQLPLDLLYSYKVDENEQQLLLDPFATEVVTTNVWGGNESHYRPLGALVPVVDKFDWEGDKPLLIPIEKLVIYEMHVRGFTQHPSSNVKHPGTFLGVIEKIPYLLDLGVNAVELLPIHEFNECEYDKKNPITKNRLYNYWGYSTLNFFSPMQRYASTNEPGAARKEFKMMVKELHKNGIEVILDVVYNHTGEGNEKGPTISFKGLDISSYYMLNHDKHFLNYSGCGNTFNCNHPVTRELIRESLRYWVTEMHVDGFRFDLASILTRGTKGQPLIYPPLIEAISHDPILADVKLISESWDAAGLYQVGAFPAHFHPRWSEWNGRYRDVVRRFIKGSGASKGEFSTNISGSQDMYHMSSPCSSINFITAHDGFTLHDLVTYMRKHNEENGENNRDGFDANDSWNCGAEGVTNNKTINALRIRQMKNFLLALMVSRGVPMLVMGDEYAHTKKGNNNTWCQDSDLNWFRWDLLEKNASFWRFSKGIIQFHNKHPVLHQNKFLGEADIQWHGLELLKPEWEKNNHFIAFTLKDSASGWDLYVAFNAGPQKVTVHLPQSNEKQRWRWVVDTSQPSPNDFFEPSEPAHYVEKTKHEMLPYSSLMIAAEVKSHIADNKSGG